MRTLEELEQERFHWSMVMFPQATSRSSLLKLHEELAEVEKELDAEYNNPDYDSQSLREEYADCLMCLFDSAGRAGISVVELREAFEKKLAKNKARKWVKNPNNTYGHVKP